MNRRALLLVITGVVAAIAATVVIYFLITNLQQEQAVTPQPTPPAVERRVVVVAAVDIAAGTTVTNSQVTTATYNTESLQYDVITSTTNVVGRKATTRIFAGEPLFLRQFTDVLGSTSATVPPGKVLVAFPSTDMLNATGAVQEGDRVDIMLSIPISGTTRLDASAGAGTQIESGERTLVAQLTLQNITVRNVGQWTGPDQQAQNAANNALKIITFEVDPQEALILKYVKDSGGTIDLAVRSAQDTEIRKTDPVTIDYLADLFDFIGLTQPSQPVPSAPPAP